MKKLMTLVFVCISALAQAQDVNDPKTLFGNNPLKQWGLVLNPSIQGAEVYGEPTLFTQVGLGLVINQRWTVGGFLGSTPFEIYPAGLQGQFNVPTDFSLYTYGGFLSYSLQPNRLIHLSFPLAMGVIETDMDERDWDGPDAFDGVEGDDYRIFVEPGLNVELNVHKYVRFFTGMSYRFHGGSLYRFGGVPRTGDYFLVNAGLRIGVLDIAALGK